MHEYDVFKRLNKAACTKAENQHCLVYCTPIVCIISDQQFMQLFVAYEIKYIDKHVRIFWN